MGHVAVPLKVCKGDKKVDAGTDRDLLCRSRRTMFKKESKSVSQVEAQAKEPQSSGELLERLKAVCILGKSPVKKNGKRK